VRALILAAGLGTRLRPLTLVRAKAAIPVNGESLVHRIARGLAASGFRDLVINLHHRPSTITTVMGDGSDLGVRLRYSWEQPVLGSAGGPRHALPLLVDGDDDPRARFLLVNGDTLTSADPQALVRAHEEAGDAVVTMALIPNPQPEKYGGVTVNGNRVTGFTRPSAAGSAGVAERSYHFIGLQVAEARAFSALPDGVPLESVGDVYRRLLAGDPRAIGAWISDATFQDIGTPDDYLRTSLELAAVEGPRLSSGTGVRVDSSAALTDTAVWDDVIIGPGAHLNASIVCDGARVPAGARYIRCVILPARGRTPAAGQHVEGGLLISPF
jgi:mannose-1-phosphate guanylyltransferase